jgi:uncharacterized delta-60 repeat protein
VVFGFGVFNSARAIALQGDGKIVVAGEYRTGGPRNFMVARFNPDGTVDNTFALVGQNIIDFAGGDDYANAVAIAPDGKIVVAGTVWSGARMVFGVARFNDDGTLDTSFDGDGKRLYEFVAGPTHWASGVAVQSDRKIVVSGYLVPNFALVRFNEDGTLDGTFGLSGPIQIDMGGNDYANAITPYGAGFYVVGSSDAGGPNDFALAQLKTNGTLHTCPPIPCTGWSTGEQFGGFTNGAVAEAVDVRSDGEVLAAGCAGPNVAWAQLAGARITNKIAFNPTLVGTTCALGARFYGANYVVVAGDQTFNGNHNFFLARFYTRSNPLAGMDDGPEAIPSVRLRAAFPNPFAEQTTIAFDLPRAQSARVVLYDVAGRLVRTLADGLLSAGRHESIWDGRDDEGHHLKPGVYFASLDAGANRVRRSLVLLR